MFKNTMVSAVVSSLAILVFGFVIGLTFFSRSETGILPLVARLANPVLMVILSIILIAKNREIKELKSKLNANNSK